MNRHKIFTDKINAKGLLSYSNIFAYIINYMYMDKSSWWIKHPVLYLNVTNTKITRGPEATKLSFL